MESFFPGWLISIGRYVEKLIKHGCFKEGKTPQILAEFPGRSSLTRQFNKLCPWLLHSSPMREGRSAWMAVKCQWGMGQRLSIFTFILFSDGTLPSQSLLSFVSSFFHSKHFCQWCGKEVFDKVIELSRCEMALPFNYMAVWGSVSLSPAELCFPASKKPFWVLGPYCSAWHAVGAQ